MDSIFTLLKLNKVGHCDCQPCVREQKNDGYIIADLEFKNQSKAKVGRGSEAVAQRVTPAPNAVERSFYRKL